VARGDVTLKENIPQDNTEHQDEPEVFFETYDPSTDTWETRFRGFLINGGLIDRNNEIKVLLYDFVKYYGGAEITVDKSDTTSTNVEVLKDAVSDLDVVIDHPTETQVQNNSDQDGFVRYDDYSMVKVPRKRVIREQTKVTGWALKPTGDQDGNGDWIWRYEPVGYGGTVDTIKDKSVAPSVSGSKGLIREWGFSQKEDIINKVELINAKDGGTVVGSYSADSEASPNSFDRFGERYENFQIGFLDSNRADELAKKIVDRNKTSQEGGNLKATPRYEGNEANNSFEVKSVQKDVDGVFTCQEQINHYPERSTDFTFTFERQSEGEAAAAENLREERRKLYVENDIGVGNQTVQDDTQNSSSDLSRTQDVDTEATSNDSKYNIQRAAETGIQGVETDQGYFFGNYKDDVSGDNGSGWTAVDTFINLSSDYDYLFHASFVSFYIEFDPAGGQTTQIDLFVRLYNRTTGEYFPTSSGVQVGAVAGAHVPAEYNQITPATYLHAPFNWIGDEIQLEYDVSIGANTSFFELSYAYHGSRGHIHDDDIEVEDDEFNVKKPSVVFDTDPDASITSQPVFTDNGHFHVIDTTTDPKTIKSLIENNTSR